MDNKTTTAGDRKCPRCGGVPENNTFWSGVCYDCFLAMPYDDDLRDEVAKAALNRCLIAYSLPRADEAVLEAFKVADLFMAERARRREDKP